MGIKYKFEKFYEEAERRNGDLTWWQRLCLLLDYIFENKVKKVPMDEFFKYEFYLKNRAGREAFSTQYKRHKFFDRFNTLLVSKKFSVKK